MTLPIPKSLESIIEAHHQWLNSGGEIGRQADLSGPNNCSSRNSRKSNG